MKQHPSSSTMRNLILLCISLVSLYSTSTLAGETSAEIRFIQLSSNNNTLTIPSDALVMRDGVTGVYVSQQGQARFRMLRVSDAKLKHIEILSGLFGNETIIAGNTDMLYDGYSLKGDDK